MELSSSVSIVPNVLHIGDVAELKHKINLKAMQLNIAQMFLNGTKPAIFYTRCYTLPLLLI
jgi:hypothetical protein